MYEVKRLERFVDFVPFRLVIVLSVLFWFSSHLVIGANYINT
jgi:hypothetical protein